MPSNIMHIGEIITDISDFIPIKDFETYAVNKKGEILNLRSKRLMKLYPNNTNGGYLQVALINENGYKLLVIHQIVAKTFIPLIEGKPYIDHIDRNIINNNIDNLRWVNIYEQAENRGVQKISKTQKKYIQLEDVKTKKNPNPSWRITIKNIKCNYKKRFEYATHTLDDIIKIRDEILLKHNIKIID
tara:strand:+ start:541 stop:1101 length:561 start_codon:yes stop_codon:yes gene_type:complete